MNIRSLFNLSGEKPKVFFTKPSLTEQHHKDACDINNVIRRYDSTGVLDHVNARAPMFDDLSILPEDYLQAHEINKRAEDAFMSLPAKVRERFGYDPSSILEFLANPANRDEAVVLGLISQPALSEDKAAGGDGEKLDI